MCLIETNESYFISVHYYVDRVWSISEHLTCYSIYIPVPEYFHIGFPHWTTHKFRLHDVGQDLGWGKWSWVMCKQVRSWTPLKILIFCSAWTSCILFHWDFWCHDAWPHWRSLVLGSLVCWKNIGTQERCSKFLSYVSLVLWLCMNYLPT